VPLRLSTVASETVQTEDSSIDAPLTDEELTALALGTESMATLPDDEDVESVQPWMIGGGALPLWYMPPVARMAKRRWTTPIVVAVISAFLLIDGMGLCNTYGLLSL
jgi:hypothetical protein